jgi:outer membrane protein assembly factor BamB
MSRPDLWSACCLVLFASAAAAEDWTQFRGPTGEGTTTTKGLPVEWGPEQNVVWRVDVPGLGWSSPVVQGERVFLTTAVPVGGDADGPQSLRTLCLNAGTGKTLWDVEVFRQPEDPVHQKNSHASPTPIVEGERVFVHFGTHGTACLTTAGEVVWKQSKIAYDMVHGTGGSPALVGDVLAFSCDGAKDPFVVALDKHTGEVRWKSPRPVVKDPKKFAFSTPLVIEVDGQPQLVSPAAGQVVAYEPQTGSVLWTVPHSGYSVIPRPVYGHGLVFLSSSYNTAELLAIRPGTSERKAEVVWKARRGAPHTPSPLLVGDELYFVSDNGIGSCVDARTGKVHWQQRLEGNYSASPLFGDGKVYFQSEQGVGTVVQAGPEFERLAQNDLGSRTLASVAVVDADFLIRTEDALYRVSAP